MSTLENKGNIKFGNKKLPKSTAIFNICAAHDCPSRARGMCQVINSGHRCYALRDEQRYKNALAYRRRQEKTWDSLTATEFAESFAGVMSRRRSPVTALRVNESGDFRSQKDVDKLAEIARQLLELGVTVYCYTARHDLEFGDTGPLVINGSGFKVDGEFRFVRSKKDRPKGYRTCPADCTKCKRCLKGRLTVVLAH